MSRLSEERRPTTTGLVELHVFYVPEKEWNSDLNKTPMEAIERFISAGFIRVCPDISLKTLREELGVLLGVDWAIDNFSFLKSVGRSLALVKAKQEGELKVKVFVPPFAPQPELYLLPRVDHDCSAYSHTLSADRPGYHTMKCDVPALKNDASTFPQVNQVTGLVQQHSRAHCLEDDERVGSSEDEEEDFQSSLYSGRRKVPSPTKSVQEWFHSDLTDSSIKRKTVEKKSLRSLRNRTTYMSLSEPHKDQDPGLRYSQDRKSKDSEQLKCNSKKPSSQNHGTLPPLSPSPQYTPPEAAPYQRLSTYQPSVPAFLTDNEFIKELKLAKEERMKLERTRQELLRKCKDLMAQNRHRKNQARDSWKKKYFNTKKATAPLQDSLSLLRRELETFYLRLFQQLQARDGGSKAKRPGKAANAKNELIIQIMTERYETDKLKKKGDDAKMKLVTECKLRKQATTELWALKAELSQKKTESSFPQAH